MRRSRWRRTDFTASRAIEPLVIVLEELLFLRSAHTRGVDLDLLLISQPKQGIGQSLPPQLGVGDLLKVAVVVVICIVCDQV